MTAFRHLEELLQSNKKGFLLTVVAAETEQELLGKKALFQEDGTLVYQEIPSDLTEEIWKEAQPLLVGKNYALLAFEMTKGKAIEVFLESYSARPRALLFGAGHVSQPTAQLLHAIGCAVTVIDDRHAFANVERFPYADEILVAPFEEAVKQVDVDPNTYVLLMTRGHRYDYLCLEALLDQELRFLGMLGSRSRAMVVRKKLLSAGFSPEAVAKLHCPVGLDIGGETPEELAVSIVSQIIAVKNHKALGGIPIE